MPCLTFFKDDARQEIDWELQDRHFDFLVDSGLHGSKYFPTPLPIHRRRPTATVIIAGSNGEAVTLSTREKTDLVQHARQRARLQSRPDIPVTLGCSGQATRQVVDEAIAAGDAGADFALVLMPSYYHFAMDADAIVSFFQEVADHSPVPVMVYNFPGVSAGIDVDADMLCALSKHANIAGVKLTCGGIGKVPRVTAGSGAPFGVLSGQVDWMVPALSVGAIGAITGMANLFPRVRSLIPV